MGYHDGVDLLVGQTNRLVEGNRASHVCETARDCHLVGWRWGIRFVGTGAGSSTSNTGLRMYFPFLRDLGTIGENKILSVGNVDRVRAAVRSGARTIQLCQCGKQVGLLIAD